MVKIPKLPSTSLCKSFSDQAIVIWTQLVRAHSLGILRDEETITNDLLLTLQSAHPTEIATFQFRKVEEKFTGADWEWWITDGTRWVGFLVQAKILNRNSGKYTTLHHKVGAFRTPQIKLLIAEAERKRVVPIYIFYNYTWSTVINCCDPGIDTRQFGCTVAHANVVQNHVGQGGAGLPTLADISLPLRCMVCCDEGSISLPDRAARAVARAARVSTTFNPYAPDKAGMAGPGSDIREPIFLDSPPPYVERLLKSKNTEERRRVIREVLNEVGAVRSVVVMRQSPRQSP
ncbi:DUF6615 family protein [Methylocystis borbori]|uniref:DUF6615 family protein n=1 Tax=Methylocystis borbori TaxID=3118750 RepID=UPI0038CC0857